MTDHETCPTCGQEVKAKEHGGYLREAERKLAVAVDALSCLAGDRGEHLTASSVGNAKRVAREALDDLWGLS